MSSGPAPLPEGVVPDSDFGPPEPAGFNTPPTATEKAAAFDFDSLPDAPRAETDAEFGAPERVFDLRPELPSGVVPDTPQRVDPSFAAFQATHSGLTPEQAAEALRLSRQTGFAPEMTAGNADALKQRVARDALEARLQNAPGVAAYASRGHVEASAIKDDVGPLARLEWALTGKWEMYPAPEDVRAPTGEFVTRKGDPMVRLVTPPFWAREFAAGLAEQKTAAMQLKAGTVGLSPEDEAALRAREAAPPQDFGEEGRTSRLVGEVARQLPGLLELGAGATVGGVAAPIVTRGKVSPQAGAKVGAAFVMFAQTYGPLYRRLAALPADDGVSPLLSDNEAKALAAVGSAATSYGASSVGLPFLQKLPGVATVFERIGADGLAQAMARPGVAQALAAAGAKFGQSYLHGLAMVGVQAAGEQATEEVARLGSKQGITLQLPAGTAPSVARALQAPIDIGHAVANAVEKAWASLAVISAYHPTVEVAGEALRARAENVRIRKAIDEAKSSGLVGREPGIAAQVIDEMGGAKTAYVDKQAFDGHYGDAAPQAGGRGYPDAETTGGPVPVPLRDHLTTGLDAAAALVDDTKLSPDALTLNEAKGKAGRPDTLTSLMAERSWILQTEADTPERTAKIADLTDRMRGVASSGPGRPGLGRIATPEEVAIEMAKLEAPAEDVSPYATAKPIPVVADDVAEARAHIESSKLVGELGSTYYETAARRAMQKALRLATEPDAKGEAILQKYAEALNVSMDTVRNAVQGTFAAEGLAEVRKKVRTSETEANRLEGGRLETLRNLEEQHATIRQDRQSQIDQLRRQEANSRALAQADAELHAEMTKVQGKLLKGTDEKSRGLLGKAGPEYLDAHDALFSAVFGSNAQPGALEPLLARMEQDGAAMRTANGGWLASFDINEIRGLLADPLKWDELSLAQARKFADAVTNIRDVAKHQNETAIADRRATFDELIGQIGEEASTRKDVGAPAITRSAASAGESMMRKAGSINAANLKPETIFGMLGETAQRFYEEKVIKGRNYKAELQGEILRYFEEHFDKQMRALSGDLAKPVKTALTVPETVDLDGSRMNQETLAMAFLNLGTPSNEEALLGGYAWNKGDVLDAIGKNLKPETVRILQGILSYNDEKLWPLVSAHAEKMTGLAPPKIVAQPITISFADGTTETFDGGYFPRAPHPDALSIPSRGGDGIQNLDRFAQATIQASFIKTRVEGAEYPVDLNWSRYPAHLASVMHYLAYDEPVRDVGRLLRDDRFRRTVRHYVGDPYLDQLDDDLRIWARGSADGMRSINAVSQLFSGVLRSRAVSNALAFSTPIALGQESHIQYAITSGEISLKNGTAAMVRALVPENWTAATEASSELRFRADHYAAQFREALSGTNAKSDIRRSLDVAAFAQMDMADRVLSHVIWDAAYNDALGQDLAHAEAVTQANRKLRLLMPTHNVLEMAPIVRDRGVIGALMLFRGLPNVVWNVEAGLYDEAHQQMAAAVGPKMIAAAGGRAALNGARAVASLAVLHMLGRVLMGHGKKDEDGPGLEGWATWAEREAISSQFSRIPLGRDVMEPFVDAYFHDKTAEDAIRELASGRHLAPDVSVIHGILRDMATAANEGKDSEDRVQAGVNTLATLAGVGARPITRAGRYAYDVSQGNRSPRGPFDLAGGLVYGERDRQDKNPFTATQDVLSGE